jgi:hypothetical protein
MRSSHALEVEILGEEHYGAWDDFVAGQEHTGSIYSTAQYLDILCRAAGGSFSGGNCGGDSFVAGLALYRRRAHGHEVISQRWLLSYNGPVLLDALLTATSSHSRGFQVLDALCRFLGRQKVAGVTLHCRGANQDFRPFLIRGWRVSPAYTIVVPTADVGSCGTDSTETQDVWCTGRKQVAAPRRPMGISTLLAPKFTESGRASVPAKGPFRRFFGGLAVRVLVLFSPRGWQAGCRQPRNSCYWASTGVATPFVPALTERICPPAWAICCAGARSSSWELGDTCRTT